MIPWLFPERTECWSQDVLSHINQRYWCSSVWNQTVLLPFLSCQECNILYICLLKRHCCCLSWKDTRYQWISQVSLYWWGKGIYFVLNTNYFTFKWKIECEYIVLCVRALPKLHWLKNPLVLRTLPSFVSGVILPKKQMLIFAPNHVAGNSKWKRGGAERRGIGRAQI